MPMPDNVAAGLPWILRHQLWAKQTDHYAALERMIACGAPAAAIRIVKAPQGAHGTFDPGYQSLVSAFIDALRPQSLFYRVIAEGAGVQPPLYTRVAFTATPPTATLVAEGSAKPLAAVGPLTFMSLLPQKVAAPDVFTSELLDDVSGPGQTFFARRLQQAVAAGVDSAFIQTLITGATSTPSSGTAATNARKDLRVAAQLVNTTGAGRFFWACAPDVANKAATLGDSAGASAFPAMSLQGGELVGPCFVSSGMPAGDLLLLDAHALVANSGTIETRVSSEADMLMSTTPSMSSATPTPATMVSMWQTNCVGYVVEATFGATKLRNNAAAIITGIDWGGP